jgi:hypothetical protein
MGVKLRDATGHKPAMKSRIKKTRDADPSLEPPPLFERTALEHSYYVKAITLMIPFAENCALFSKISRSVYRSYRKEPHEIPNPVRIAIHPARCRHISRCDRAADHSGRCFSRR